MRKVAGITAIVVGIIMAVAGMVTWVVIGNTLVGPEDRRVGGRRLFGR